MKRLLVLFLIIVAALSISAALAAEKPGYVGFKKCGGCHTGTKDSWLDTSHATAFELLKPKQRAKAKEKAGLRPNEDYTKDKTCLPCHTTGFGEKGGYETGMDKAMAEKLEGVGCEMCHGAGGLFVKKMTAARKQYKKTKQKTQRTVLVEAGKNYDTEESCNGCHMNYKGSPWKGAKSPYSPHTPEIDAKYKFNFEKAVRNFGAKGMALHEHYKITGIFEGKPTSKLRDEFQKKAKEEEPAPETKEEE